MTTDPDVDWQGDAKLLPLHLKQIAEGDRLYEDDRQILVAAAGELDRLRADLAACREERDADVAGWSRVGAELVRVGARAARLEAELVACREKTLTDFADETERTYPNIRQPDSLSDWGLGVTWAIDRARAAAVPAKEERG